MRRATIAAIVVIVGSALAWLLLLDARRAPKAVASVPAAVASEGASRPAAITRPVLDPRVGSLLAMDEDLAERVAQLESELTAGEPATAAMAEDPNEARRRSVEARRAGYAKLIEQHEESPIDPAWASASSTTLRNDLSMLAGEIEGARLEAVDCRSSSCIARLALSSFEAARTEAARLVRGEYGLSCAAQIQLDDAADAQAPYELRIVFHSCENEA